VAGATREEAAQSLAKLDWQVKPRLPYAPYGEQRLNVNGTAQNGLTTTKITMAIMIAVGTSLAIR